MLPAVLWAWRHQERLRLLPLLALAAAFQAALVGVHLAVGAEALGDLRVYQREGSLITHGHYPSSEYPTGAVLLFGLESLLGGGSVRTAHAYLMIPFHLFAVAAIWSLRSRWSPWLAAVVAIWPLNSFYWEFRFDLVPAAFLAVALALAYRRRWTGAGIVAGLGVATKWTPGLAVLVLAAWLLASDDRRAAARLLGGAAGGFLLVTLPLFAWAPHNVIHAWTAQGGRTLTDESIWYPPLKALGLASGPGEISDPASVPSWANGAATAVQLVLLAAMLVLAVRLRGSLVSAVALAALTPVVFLLTNRVFSAQFVVVLLVAWAVAAALVARDARDQLRLGGAALLVTLLNVLVYPATLGGPSWMAASELMFLTGLVLTGFLVIRASRQPQVVTPPRGRERVAAAAG
jgi:hypothetical protein